MNYCFTRIMVHVFFCFHFYGVSGIMLFHSKPTLCVSIYMYYVMFVWTVIYTFPFRILGNYPYYLGKSDEIFYKKCPEDLYQPLPAWSYEMSDCEFKKSSCNSIGQVPCDNGSATDDATCGCDYTKGFVLKESDCLYHICEHDLQEIDSGIYGFLFCFIAWYECFIISYWLFKRPCFYICLL